MLELELPERRYFDESTRKFFTKPPMTLRFEHSLLSLSKWESIWEVPFLSRTSKTDEQLRSYLKCMSFDPITDDTIARLTETHYTELQKYLGAKHSATWFNDEGSGGGTGQTVTSELIYFWMASYNIPFECESWQLPRLMNLIKIASIKNDTDPKKNRRSRSQMLSERAALNAKRRAEAGNGG